MGRQGWSDAARAGSNVQVDCTRHFAVALPTIRIRDPTEEVPVIVLPGCDDDRAKAFLPHLASDVLECVAEIGTVGVEAKDLVLNFDGKDATAGDGIVNRGPAVILVVSVVEQGWGAGSSHGLG